MTHIIYLYKVRDNKHYYYTEGAIWH